MTDLNLQAAVVAAVTPSSERADDKVKDVIASWAFNPGAQEFIKSLIEGTEVEGIKTGRIYNSDKIGFEKIGSGLFGYYGYLPTGRIDVPVHWLDAKWMAMFDTNSTDGVNSSRITFWNWDKKSKGLVLTSNLMGSEGSNKHVIKLMMLAKDSATRKTWESRISSLLLFPDYRINAKVYGDIPSMEDINHAYPALLKEEHALKGFVNFSMPDSVFAHNVKDGIIAMENPKKALARISRLVQHPDAVNMGEYSFFIAKDVPSELTEWFYTGSGYCPTHLLGRVGGFRAVNEYGLKMTSMVYPETWEEALGDTFMLSKASFKSGANGIAKLLFGTSDSYLANADSDEVRLALDKELDTVFLDGHTVEGWYVDMPLHITSLYSLYGLRTVEEYDDGLEDDLVDSDTGDIVAKGSFYTESLNILSTDADYDLIGTINDKLKADELRYAPQRLNIKMQEINTSYWTHGDDVSQKFMENVVDASSKYMRESGKLGLDTMSDADVDVTVFPEGFLKQLAYRVYPVKGPHVQPGILDPNQYPDVNAGRNAIMYLLFGNDADEADLWDGLFGGKSKVFMVGDKEFFIPNGEVMNEYAHAEDGSERIFMSGPAQALQSLFISIKNPKTDWELKQVNHNMDMQSNMYGDTVDNFPVKGFGNKAMLPAPWLRQDVLTTLDPVYVEHDGEHVMGSKMPVLFDTAVSGFVLRTTLPSNIFGDVDDRMRLALRNMVFTNVHVMMDLRNDTDGDMHRVALVKGIPLHVGVPEHMKEWRANYLADESDLQCKYKDYKFYDMEDIDEAVIEASDNKQYVGKATNALATLGHILQVFVSKGKLSYEVAKVIRASYAMSIQDYIVAGIKHETDGDGNLFKEADLNMALYNAKIEKRNYARDNLKVLIGRYNSSVVDDLDTFLLEWDNYACMSSTENCVTPLASRRTSSITGHDYYQVKDEFYMKELDMFTRSYLRNSNSAQPEAGLLGSWNPDVKVAYLDCLANLDSYKDKYLMWEQVLPVHTDTMIGKLFTYWKNK